MRDDALSTERLRLRPLQEADIDALIQIAGDRRIADGTISVPHPFDRNAAVDFIQALERGRATGERFGFAVCLGEGEGRLVGYAGLHHVDVDHAEAELSFWIGAAHEGRGYVREAGERLIRYAFDELGLNRVCAFHMRRNAGSERVLERLGFQREGLLRQRVRKWGVFEDVVVWSRLRGDRSDFGSEGPLASADPG